MQLVAQAASDSHAADQQASFTGENLTIVGWLVFLIGLYAVNKTRMGHKVIFLGLSLIVFFLFLNNYQQINGVLFKKGGNGQ